MQNLTELVVRTLVLYSLHEVQLGHAKTIWVEVGERSFSVADDGRGHAIDRTVDDAPYLQFVYGHLDYPFGSTAGKPIQLQGLGMSLLSSLCAELSVIVCKPDARLHLRYRDGQLVGRDYSDEGSSSTGNRISGTVRDALAMNAEPEQSLRAWLLSVASAMPKVTLRLNGELLGTAASGVT